MRDLRTTRKILRAWGAWSNNSVNCDWYREAPGMSNVLPREAKPYYETLTDEEAAVVDKIVLMMHDEKNPRPMTFFILSYVYGMNNCEIARRATKADKKKCSEGKVRNALMLMETFVQGALASQESIGLSIEFECTE
ncbi:TPA: antiterminator Q family protein [Vibrio cholerae]